MQTNFYPAVHGFHFSNFSIESECVGGRVWAYYLPWFDALVRDPRRPLPDRPTANPLQLPSVEF